MTYKCVWWRIAQYEGDYYIISATSGKCLDVPSGSNARRLKIIQSECHGGDNQVWTFDNAYSGVTDRQNQGYRQVISQSSGLCLEIPNFSSSNGVRLEQNLCKNASAGHTVRNQAFLPLPAYQGSHLMRLQLEHSRKCVDLPGGVMFNGANIQQYDCHYGVFQEWLLVPAF